MSAPDSASAVGIANTSTYTRIRDKRLLSFARVLWGILAFINIGIFVIGMLAYEPFLRRGCLCEIIADIEHVDGAIILHPLDEGLTSGIGDGDILVAVDDSTILPTTSPDDVVALINGGQTGTSVTLTVRSGDSPARNILLTRTPASSFVRYMAVLGLSVDAATVFRMIFVALSMTGVSIVAMLIVWRRSDDWVALYGAWTLIAFGLAESVAFGVLDATQGSVWLTLYKSALMGLALNYAIIFPDGRYAPRWTPIMPVIFAVWTLLVSFGVGGLQIGGLLAQAVDLLIVIFVVGIIVHRYRHALSPTHRQQTKWALYGISIGILVSQAYPVLLEIVELADPIHLAAYFSFVGFPLTRTLVLVLPIGLAFAMMRYRLWDIDLALNRSLVYGAVTAFMALVFLGGGLVLQAVLGQANSGLAFAVSIIGAGLLFNPARKRVQHVIDRRFYGFRFDLNELQQAQQRPGIANPGALTGKTLGKYQIWGVIGRGGMGEVYEGEGDGHKVAVKILPDDLAKEPDFRKRFAREAQTLAEFSHPNIVKLYDSGESDGIYYMALEFIEGRNLSDILHERGHLPLDEVHPFIDDFAATLDYAHSRGLIHRDIKPSNIMIRTRDKGETQEAVLMDFGIAKVQDARTALTGTGAIGTIDYMAPEQIMAAKAVDYRADIYALGVVLYEMLTGKRPFSGSAGQVLFAHLQHPPPDARDVHIDIPAHIAAAIMRAMAKQPDDRFQSAADFAAALQPW